jgi:hypothetical protein
LQDYYATLNGHDDRADYYDKKFSDPDKVAKEEAEGKTKSKELTPEEAALIKLPSTTIDTDMGIPIEFISSKQRQEEILNKPEAVAPVEVKRKLASVSKPKVVKTETPKPQFDSDLEVNTVLVRLHSIGAEEKQSAVTPDSGRMPASQSVVADPVYDFSQNF